MTILLLASAAAAFVVRPWQNDRDSNETTATPEISSRPPSGLEPADTASCGTATSSTAELTEITSGRHGTFDRIVLAFDGSEPECSASYVDQIVADGSGQPISFDGNAFLKVTLRGAAAHDDAGNLTYNGPEMIHTPELENIRGVTLAGDFEGYVTIGSA